MDEKIKELLERIPFAKEAGIELMEVGEGYAKGRIRMERKHQNPYGGMHGGCIFTLADTIAGLAAYSNGNFVTTVNSDIHYLSPVANTEYVFCEAQEVRQGKTIGVYDAWISDDAGNVCVTATFTYFKLKEKIE